MIETHHVLNIQGIENSIKLCIHNLIEFSLMQNYNFQKTI